MNSIVRGYNLWCEETKTTVKIIICFGDVAAAFLNFLSVINNNINFQLPKFQLSDKALDLVKDPNGGNVTIPPQEGSTGDERPVSVTAEKGWVYRFQLSSAAPLPADPFPAAEHNVFVVVVDRDWLNFGIECRMRRGREMLPCRRQF